MKTRLFVSILSLVGVVAAGVSHAQESAPAVQQSVAKVYFTRDLSPEGILKVYRKVNQDICGKVAIKGTRVHRKDAAIPAEVEAWLKENL